MCVLAGARCHGSGHFIVDGWHSDQVGHVLGGGSARLHRLFLHQRLACVCGWVAALRLRHVNLATGMNQDFFVLARFDAHDFSSVTTDDLGSVATRADFVAWHRLPC